MVSTSRSVLSDKKLVSANEILDPMFSTYIHSIINASFFFNSIDAERKEHL